MVMMMAMDQRSHLGLTLPKSQASVNAADHNAGHRRTGRIRKAQRVLRLSNLQGGLMFSADSFRKRKTLLMVFAAALLLVGLAAAQKNASPSKSNFDTYHAGPWEQTIGYSQAVRNGNM